MYRCEINEEIEMTNEEWEDFTNQIIMRQSGKTIRIKIIKEENNMYRCEINEGMKAEMNRIQLTPRELSHTNHYLIKAKGSRFFI